MTKTKNKVTSEKTNKSTQLIPFAGELPEVTAMPEKYNTVGFDKIIERKDPYGMTMYYYNNPDTGQEEMLKELGNGKYMTMDGRSIFDVPKAKAIRAEQAKGTANNFDKVMLGALALGTAPITLSAAASILPSLAPGSTFWMNPLTKQMVAGTVMGEGVNLGTKVLSGRNSFGQLVGDAVEDVSGWNPNNKWWGQFVTEAFNPGWYRNPTRVMNTVGKVGNAVENGVGKVTANAELYNATRKPVVPEGYITVKPQVRTRVGDVEIDDPGLYYHQSDAGKAENFVSTGRMRTPLEEYWLAKEKAGEHIPIMLRTGVKPGYPQTPGRAMFAQGKLWYGLTPGKPDLLVTAREMPIANKNASIMSDEASLRSLENQGSRRVTNDNIYTQGPHNTQNTLAYIWEPGYGYKRVFAEKAPAAKWADAARTPQTIAENASTKNSSIIRTVQDNGKIRLSLSSHTKDKPRQFVLEPQGNNKFYVHMRTWDGDHIPANLTSEEKQALFNGLYKELPEGAEILFPKSGPGNYATRGTVAGLERLKRDTRFTPGTKGTLQYLDKDGKTIKTFEGTSFIKAPTTTSKIRTKKQGGKMNTLQFLKNGSGIHIKKLNRGNNDC